MEATLTFKELLLTIILIGSVAVSIYYNHSNKTLRKKHKQESSTASRLLLLLESSQDPILFTTKDGAIAFWNKSASTLFGYSEDEAVGKDIGSLIARDDIARGISANFKRSDKPNWRQEFLARKQSGDPFFAEVSVSSCNNIDGFDSIAIIKDISFRREMDTKFHRAVEEADRSRSQLQEEIKKSNKLAEAAQQASRSKSQFLASMSHELRTPLNGILGYSQILLRKNDLKPKHKEGIEIISKSADHLLTLINDILDLSKIEAGKTDLSNDSFHLASFIKNLDDMMRLRAKEKGLFYLSRPYNFNTNEPGGKLPAWVIGDEKRLRQVIINLLGNALKFTENGNVLLKVGRSPDAHTPNLIRFQIEDTGPGIAKKDQSRIFEAFEQTEAGQLQGEGSGLGLAISNRLLQMMDSRLVCESEPGSGSTFWFDVLLPGDPNLSPVIKDATHRHVIAYSGKPIRTLIVDDIEAHRKLISELLTAIGFEVIEAQSCNDALRKYKRHHPMLTIADLIMPGGGGVDLVKQIREFDKLPNAKLIAISADVSDTQIQSAHEAGFDTFLPKPIQTDDLLETIKRILKIEWVYNQDAQPIPEQNDINDQAKAAPPQAVLEALLAHANIGDLITLNKNLDTLLEKGDYTAFANYLKKHARSFEGAKICNYLEELIRAKENAQH